MRSIEVASKQTISGHALENKELSLAIYAHGYQGKQINCLKFELKSHKHSANMHA